METGFLLKPNQKMLTLNIRFWIGEHWKTVTIISWGKKYVKRYVITISMHKYSVLKIQWLFILKIRYTSILLPFALHPCSLFLNSGLANYVLVLRFMCRDPSSTAELFYFARLVVKKCWFGSVRRTAPSQCTLSHWGIKRPWVEFSPDLHFKTVLHMWHAGSMHAT